MELLDQSVHAQAIEKFYTIQHPTEGVLVYKEWIDSENGKCIDFILHRKGGCEIYEADLIEEVQEFVDNLA